MMHTLCCRPSIKPSYLKVLPMHRLNGMLVSYLVNYHLHLRSHSCLKPPIPLQMTLTTISPLERLPQSYLYFASPGQNSGLSMGFRSSVLSLMINGMNHPSLNRLLLWITLGMRYFSISLATSSTTYQRKANLT